KLKPRNAMDAPKCIVCNTRHWSTQPCPAFADVIAEERKQQIARHAVTKPSPEPVTKPVTKPPEQTVTKPASVTKPPAVTKPNKGGRPLLGDKPMSAAERMQRYRANRKAKRVTKLSTAPRSSPLSILSSTLSRRASGSLPRAAVRMAIAPSQNSPSG